MSRGVPLTFVVAAILAVAPAAAGAATQRYATPNGAATGECPQNAPCDIYTAFTKAQANDEVIIGTGDYGSAGAPLAAPIVSTTAGLDVHGEGGKPRPRIFGATTTSDSSVLDLSGSGVKLHDLEIHQLGTPLRPAALTFDGASADDVVAITTGSQQGRGCVLLGNSVLVNSVCDTDGSQGVGILPYRQSVGAKANTSTIRNVTVIASGAQGLGIQAIGGSTASDAQNLTVTNTIIVVPSNQVAIQAFKQTADAIITIDHSNFGFQGTDPGHGGQFVKGAGNQQLVGNPKFVAPGDYHIAAGSMTIDKGADDAANGTTDVDGDARTLGQATDMGADEFVPPPVVTTGASSNVTRTTAGVSGTVNPERLATTYHFEYGTSTAYGASTPATDAGAGTADVPASATLTGLAAGTTYHYRLVATSAGGTTPGVDMTFATQAAPGGGGSSSGGGPGAGPHFVGGLKLSHTSFAAASSGLSVAPSAKRKVPIGTTVRFTVNAATTVRFTIERAAAGRRAGKRCVKPTKKNRKARKCTRYVRLKGHFDLIAFSGKTSFRFTGRLRGRKLPVGRYRLVGSAFNSAGAVSDTRRAAFKIVRR
jgi:hypothetical protein